MAAGVQASKAQRVEATPPPDDPNAHLFDLMPAVAWIETFADLPIRSLVLEVGKTCKLFKAWAAEALKLKAQYYRQNAGGSARPNIGFVNYVKAFKSLRKEELTWEQFGAKYANPNRLFFHRIDQFPEGFLRGVQMRCAPTLKSLTEKFSGDEDELAELIGAATKLKSVQMTNLGKRTLTALCSCKHLTSVNFTDFDLSPASEKNFGDHFVQLLTSGIQLEEFHMDVIDMTVPLLTAMTAQKGLRKLTLGKPCEYNKVYEPHRLGHPSEPIRKQLVVTLTALNALEFLHLKQDSFQCPLNQPDKYYVTDETLGAVAKSAPGLRALALQNCCGISAKGVQEIFKGCLLLSSLSLKQGYVEPDYYEQANPPPPAAAAADADGAAAPAVPAGLPIAQPVEYVNPLTDDFMHLITLAPSRIRNLQLSSDEITDAGVIYAASRLKELEALDLRGCRVTYLSVSVTLLSARVLGHLRHLSFVDMRETYVKGVLGFDFFKDKIGLFTVLTDDRRYDVARGKVTVWKT